MNKSTNHFRRCPNCPHVQCCCTSLRTSRPKKAPKVREFQPQTVLAQNSVLKTENTALRRELLNVSSFLKEEVWPSQELSTATTTPVMSYPALEERLYVANRSYQECLLKVADLGKKYEQCREENSSIKNQVIKLQRLNEQLLEDREKIRRKCKKYAELEKSHQKLKQELELQKLAFNASPAWVAQTSFKQSQNNPHAANIEQSFFSPEMKFKQSLLAIISGLDRIQPTANDSSPQELVAVLLSHVAESFLSDQRVFERELLRRMGWLEKKYRLVVSKLDNLLVFLGNRALRSKIICEQMRTEVTNRIY